MEWFLLNSVIRPFACSQIKHPWKKWLLWSLSVRAFWCVPKGEMFNRKMLYMTHPPQNMHGISLIEVSVVLVILVALAGLGLPYVRSTIDDSECSLTDVTLQNVKSAIMGSPTAPGFVGDMNRMPYNLEELTTCTISTVIPHSCATTTQLTSYNPSSQSGWRGPYVSKVTRNK